MRIALDATYSLGSSLSGVGVYSREILRGLAASESPAAWDWFYRSRRFVRARNLPPNVTRRLLTDSFGKRSADIFHGLNQRLPARRFRKQIATFHDLFVLSGEYSTPDFRKRFAAQAKHAAAESDFLIAVSAFTARQIEHFFNIPAQRIRVIHHGLVPRHIPQLPRENIVLCVGAIQHRKNQAALVRAFRAMPNDWKLVLAGSQGYESQQTLDAVASSGCADRIQITGFISDEQLAEWYARASIFAFPSLDEGFGMPVIEAMAAGVPVIASNTSALPEVAGDAGFLIDPAQEDDIAQALLRLAKEPELRQTLMERGHRRAAQFTWERAVNLTLEAYNLISQTSP